VTKSSVLVIAVLAVWCTTSPVFAQASVIEGSVFPMQYDAQGGRHYYTNGYYGPMTPAMPGETNDVLRTERRSGPQTATRITRQSATILASVRHKTNRAAGSGAMASAKRRRAIR
jgi:hypothetical protein